MVTVNENYLLLKSSYIFSEINRRVEEFQTRNPDADIIRMGIGDVTRPLPGAVVEAFHRAVDEMAGEETFRGYGPEQGYPFLREAIAENDYASRGVDVTPDEIFISDGAKCDTGNIQENFGLDNVVEVTDPVYPVYVESNVMAGGTGPMDESGRYEGLVYLPCTEENDFIPPLPEEKVDL